MTDGVCAFCKQRRRDLDEPAHTVTRHWWRVPAALNWLSYGHSVIPIRVPWCGPHWDEALQDGLAVSEVGAFVLEAPDWVAERVGAVALAALLLRADRRWLSLVGDLTLKGDAHAYCHLGGKRVLRVSPEVEEIVARARLRISARGAA